MYLFISYFAYCYDSYKQIRKIPRLQRAQIIINNWILCTTKRLYPLLETESPPPFWSEKEIAPRPRLRFQLNSEKKGVAFYAWGWCLRTMVALDAIFGYYFADTALCVEIFFKRKKRIRENWFWNWGLKHLLHTCISGWAKFPAEPVCFFVAF